MEDARDDRLAVQRVVGMSLREPLPDETTILNFRHLLERHGRGEALRAEITEHLAARGVRLAGWHDRGRDHHRRAGVDDEPRPGARSSNASGSEGGPVVRRDEGPHRGGRPHGAGAQHRHDRGGRDAGCRRCSTAPRRGCGGTRGIWAWPGSGATGPAHGLAGGPCGPGGATAVAERRKAVIRALVEHPFLYVKRHFGYAQVRYRGLAKNRNRLCLWLGLANLWLAERRVTA